jgi:hypothetical protein
MVLVRLISLESIGASVVHDWPGLYTRARLTGKSRTSCVLNLGRNRPNSQQLYNYASSWTDPLLP